MTKFLCYSSISLAFASVIFAMLGTDLWWVFLFCAIGFLTIARFTMPTKKEKQP